MSVYKNTFPFAPASVIKENCRHFLTIVIEPGRWRYGNSENWHDGKAESAPGTYCLNCGAKLVEAKEVQHA